MSEAVLAEARRDAARIRQRAREEGIASASATPSWPAGHARIKSARAAAEANSEGT